MRILALLAVVLLAGCAASPTTPTSGDPFERINRGTYAFNDAIDKAVLRPVAKGYV
nr:VacJ family lipoprotein [Steroidobacteraceae bacterium]